MSGVEIYCQLCAAYGESNVMKRRSVYEWVAQFKAGWMNTHDKQWEGGLSTSINDETINIVRSLLEDVGGLNVLDIHHEMATHYSYVDIGCTSVHTIMSEHLQLTKVSARWVPRMPMAEQQEHLVQSANAFLKWYAEGGYELSLIHISEPTRPY